MDWNFLAALSQVIGAAGVVASLIYVGRQVRLGNALARAEAYRTISLRVSEMTSEWAHDDSFVPVVRASLFERSARMTDLSADDQTKLILHYSSALRVFEIIHRQVEAGVLNHGAYDMLGGIMFKAPIFSEVWSILSPAYSSDFARLVENRFHITPGSDR